MNVSSVKNLNGEVLSAVQDATLTDFVQTNSAQWGQGGGAISSYKTTWSHYIPPYGDNVIYALNEKYISAFLSNSADKSNFANNANSANSANYAETVNETYVENKGFTRNLSSEYGTISVIHNNIIESTNSAIIRTGNEGFVSSFEGHSIGPADNGTATYSWDKSLPNTTITLDMSWSHNEILTYSANTNLTGEIVLPTGVNTQTINIPNATEFKVWSNIWIGLIGAVVSAADQFETVVGELAWTSALPTYEYDTSTNKISAINGSAIGGGGGSSDTFYIYPGITTDKEISENSGKDLKLYNSANNVFLDFAGKSTFSQYALFSFKEITGTQANQNTLQHLRLRVYPNATSACKIYDTNTVSLVNSDSTVNQAVTAYYDPDGNSLTQTHSELTALNSFVQSNSAKWGQGGSTPASESVLFKLYESNDPNNGSYSKNSFVSGATDLYFEASVPVDSDIPSDIVLIHNGSEVGRACWSHVSSEGSYNYYTASYNNSYDEELEIQCNLLSYEYFNVSANGVKTKALSQHEYLISDTSNSVKFNIVGDNIAGTIDGFDGIGHTLLTSFNGNLTDFTAKGYERYNTNVNSENPDFGYNYNIIAEFGAGDGEVSHYNTLSRNGTVDSPLCVVPGYNETVLWSGSIGTNSTATLSEPYTNFERIRIAGTCGNGAVSNEAYSDDLIAASIHELSLSKPIMFSTSEDDGTYNIIAFMPCLFKDSTVETKNGRFLGYWGGKWQYQIDTAFALTKVIGINRRK